MKVLRKLATLGATASLLVAGVMVAAPASAEPVCSGFVAVGSDTIQDVMNALTNGFKNGSATIRVQAGGNPICNYDAFPSTGAGAVIQTKAAGSYFVRPSGSSNGRNALARSIDGAFWNGVTITGYVDIARSSSSATWAETTGLLAYIPFSRDGLAYAFKPPAGATARQMEAFANITTAQIKTAFESNNAVATGVDLTVALPVLGGTETITVFPRLPQSGSGTRSSFITAAGIGTVGTVADDAAANNKRPENDASILQAGWIMPFSAASWIAQKNGVSVSTFNAAAADVALGSPNGIVPVLGTAPNLSANSAYYSTSWGRDCYLIVERARITPGDPKYNATLAGAVNPTGTGTLTAWGNPAVPGSVAAVKTKFGFQAASATTIHYAYPTLP